MDLIIKIQQKIDTLESGAGEEDAKALQALLSGLDDEVHPQGAEGSIVKMMQSITKYLAANAARPHPDALPLLKTLGRDLETLVGMPSGNTAESRQILERSVLGFKELKAAISAPTAISKKEFEELKAVILSIDWEISNHTLKTFDEVISRLKHKLQFNKVHLTFLRIMHSLGAYISKNGAGADSDSITLIQSVFQNYEKLVHNPDMAAPEKKALIEGDIRKYNEFKQSLETGPTPAPVPPQPLVQTPAPAQTPTPTPTPAQADEELPPALSHLDSSGSAEDQATLSILSDSPEMDDDILEVFGSQSNQAEQPRDVMGDLFSPKTTPADELLDAIHLAELHGDDKQAPPGMMPADPSDQQEGEGVKNYVPERGGGEPIPEIESRLDAFFNLDVSENSLSPLEIEETESPAAPAEELVAQYPADPDDDDLEDIEPGLSGLVGPDRDVEPAFGTDDDFASLNTLSELDPDSPGEDDLFSPVLEDEDDEDIQPGLSGLVDPDQGAEPAFGADDDFENLNTLSELDPDSPGDDLFSGADLDFDVEDDSSASHEELPLERIPEDSIELVAPKSEEPDSSLLVDALEEKDPAEPVLARLETVLTIPAELGDDKVYSQVQEEIAGLNQIWAAEPDKRMLLDMLSVLSQYVHDSEAVRGEAKVGGIEEAVEPQPADGDMELVIDEQEPTSDIEEGGVEPESIPEEAPLTDEPLVDEPITDEPSTDELLTDEPLTDESSTDKPSTELDDEAASFDDEFAPEEVSPKPKAGFWGKLTARFRK